MELEASLENKDTECGTIHFKTGVHEVFLYTPFKPSWVWIEVQGSGKRQHCGGEIDPDLVLWSIKGEGIGLLAEIQSDFVRIKWRAIS